MFIYSVLRFTSFIVASICLLSTVYYIFVAIKRLCKGERLTFSGWIHMIKHESHNFAGRFTVPLLIISLCTILTSNAAAHQLVGIHNLKLKPEGTYCFYVEAYRSGGKTYTLPAQIKVEKERVEVGEEKSKTYIRYYIEKVFFSNGGWLDAHDHGPVEISKPAHYIVGGDEEWTLTLLNEHAYSPEVTETDNAQWSDILILLIEVSSAGRKREAA